MNSLVEGKDYFISSDGILKINEGIKYIPSFSFLQRKDIEGIIFPSSLIIIGARAFFGCSSLNGKLVIPDSVKYIHHNAFNECKIDELVIGTDVVYIGYKAFHNNNISKVINNSEKLKYICDKVFYHNHYDLEFEVKGDVVYIEHDIWSNPNTEHRLISNNKAVKLESSNECNWTSNWGFDYTDGVLKINDGVEVIGNFRQFKDCRAVEMPDSVLFIKPVAFNGLRNLEYVKFSNNLIYIGSNAFCGCNLREKRVDLPDSLCFLANNAFLNNRGYEAITVSETTPCDDSNAIYEIRTNDNGILNQTSLININDLLEEGKKILESLNLLPKTIKENIYNVAKPINSLTTITKDFLIKYIMDNNYDETTEYLFIENILSTKGIDVSDMHEVINDLYLKKQTNTIYLLIRYGYDFRNNSMISRAIINNMYDMIDVLLLLGTDINEISIIDMTPLSIACQNGNIDLVKHLIEKGAAIKVVDSRNKMAIDYAKENDNEDIVEYLNSFDKEESSVQGDLDRLEMILNK